MLIKSQQNKFKYEIKSRFKGNNSYLFIFFLYIKINKYFLLLLLNSQLNIRNFVKF